MTYDDLIFLKRSLCYILFFALLSTLIPVVVWMAQEGVERLMERRKKNLERG